MLSVEEATWAVTVPAANEATASFACFEVARYPESELAGQNLRWHLLTHLICPVVTLCDIL